MTFDFDAGALCLDLANTVEWHASDRPQDTLDDYSVLLAWGEAGGVLTADQAEQLHQLAAQQPKEAAAAWQDTIQLREALFRIFSDIAAGDEASVAECLAEGTTTDAIPSTLMAKATSTGCDPPHNLHDRD